MTEKEEDMSVAQDNEQMQVEGPGSAIVRREPLPRELAALGVKAAVDEASGMQIVIIPKELRQRANVLTPVQAFQQADPNWRPSLRVVELDPAKDGAHFYQQAGGRLAPRKEALMLLADAAGLVDLRTTVHGRERLEVGGVMAETFTHLATAKLRKSDGTLRVLEASRTYEPFAEYEDIRTQVTSGSRALSGEPAEREIRKRWLTEIKFAKAKNETKAMLRAIRAALQIPHTFSPDGAAKPFLVVGWNLAPQSTEAVQAAIAQLYGAAPTALEPGPAAVGDWDEPEPAHAEIEADEVDESAGDAQPAAREQPADPPPAVGAPGPPPDPARPPEADVEPVIEGADLSEPEPEVVEAEPEDEVVLTDQEKEWLPRALEVRIPSGSYQQRTLKWVLELGESADQWLAYALRQEWPQDQGFKRALVIVVRAERPGLWLAWQAEQ